MIQSLNDRAYKQAFYAPSRERSFSFAGNGLKVASSTASGARQDSLGSDKHFLGHGLRNFTAGALALPANAACMAHAHVVAPLINMLTTSVSAVAGYIVGVAGALVGAAVGTLFGSTLTGAQAGFVIGAMLVSVPLHGIAGAVNLAIDCVVVPSALLLHLLGWSVGAVVTAPLMVFGRYES